jgi:catechol 2,3-dioxygenase-like lactoylglutathione lyase family enzyme
MTIEINGMAHVILTVSRFDAAREFYRRLLPEFGMKVVSDSNRFFYCVGARTAIGIEPYDPALAGERFVQQRVGLHHLCLRARSREDVDKCAALLSEMGATTVRGPAEDTGGDPRSASNGPAGGAETRPRRTDGARARDTVEAGRRLAGLRFLW